VHHPGVKEKTNLRKFSNFTVLTTPTQMNQAAREGNNINNYAEEPNSIDIHHRNKLIILVPDVSREILNLRRT
jgi:hypothetical protein